MNTCMASKVETNKETKVKSWWGWFKGFFVTPVAETDPYTFDSKLEILTQISKDIEQSPVRYYYSIVEVDNRFRAFKYEVQPEGGVDIVMRSDKQTCCKDDPASTVQCTCRMLRKT